VLGKAQHLFDYRIGIQRAYVSDIERGKRNPTVTVVEKLARPLEVERGRLLD